ncbi:MAG TPA: hypothetical protein VFF65_14115 [Phycisphaerales bacterium]|nr:hypothetical protein [Phycisphaerales bacterium]
MSTAELLQTLRASRHLPLRPPTPGAADGLGRLCGGPPPPELAELYRHCDGAEKLGDAWMRPLPVSEVIASPDFGPPLLQRWRAVLCFTDDESNYAGVYTAGPLAGTVLLLNHDEPSPAPRYWTVNDLLGAIADSSIEDAMWKRAGAQLPVAMNPQPVATQAKPAALADRVRTLADAEPDEEKRRDLLVCLLHLIPATRIAEVRAALDYDDIWLPELAAEIVGAARDEASLPALVALARQRRRNGDIAAILAIGQLATPAARAALLQLAAEPGADRYAPYLARAMKEAGLHAELRAGAWFYRASPGQQWKPFGSA